MPRKIVCLILLLVSISISSLGGSADLILAVQLTDKQSAPQDRQIEARRKIFATGRDLLLNQHVPFEPEELLRDGWRERLKPILETLPEMHQNRYETAPLKGAYMADTLYLPEKVQLSGHAVILANYVVFEGKEPVIKGNFDVHFFPRQPVAVLGTTLADALRKKHHLLDVKLGHRGLLPSFALIKDLAEPGKHNITIDTSGPQLTLEQPKPKMKPTNLQTIAFSALQQPPTKPCGQSCDNNGNSSGLDGGEGNSPLRAANGGVGLAGANGDCASGQSPNGISGLVGVSGDAGQNA